MPMTLILYTGLFVLEFWQRVKIRSNKHRSMLAIAFEAGSSLMYTLQIPIRNLDAWDELEFSCNFKKRNMKMVRQS